MANIPTTIKNKKLIKKRRKQIVMAAIKCFSQKGFHETTLKDLADEAGISHGNFYKYISTKKEIFYLIHEHLYHEASEKLKRVLNGITNPVEKLHRIVRTRFELSNEYSDAIRLMYRESKILEGNLLKDMLADERRSNRYIESVLEECVNEGIFKDVNVRAISNLIVMMVDCWELKRWDLKRHINRIEFEQIVMDIILNSLHARKAILSDEYGHTKNEFAQPVLVINAGGPIGTSVTSTFLNQGSKVVAFTDQMDLDTLGSITRGKKTDNLKIYQQKAGRTTTPNRLKKILTDEGAFDSVVYCIEETGIETGNKKTLNAQLLDAQELGSIIAEHMSTMGFGRIIFIGQDSWSKLTNPIQYEVVKGGIIQLSEELSRRTASAKVNVNCIIPGFIQRPGNIRILENHASDTKTIPIHEIGEASDISNVVLFLAGHGARYITGQCIYVDGGFMHR